jgi:arabinan endo-1,5-alpha-L-arabinosidase
MKTRLIMVLSCLVCMGGTLQAQAGENGVVPVTGALGTHDPTVVKMGDTYVRFSTGRGIPVATSADLIHWELGGQVFSQNPAWTAAAIPGSGDFWAPDVVRRGTQWRMYYAVSTFGSNRSAVGLAVNDHLNPARPTEGWVDRGAVLESFPTDDFNAIDPQIAQSPEGDDWLVFGSFWSGIHMRPLSAGGSLVSGGRDVTLASRPEPPHAIEGAYLLAHGGNYYLFVSFDFCCRGKQSTYSIRIGRSAAFEGPYVDRDGRRLLEGGGTLIKATEDQDIGPGHNSVLVDGDKQYIVYHVYDARYGGSSRLRIGLLGWDAEGWPLIP